MPLARGPSYCRVSPREFIGGGGVPLARGPSYCRVGPREFIGGGGAPGTGTFLLQSKSQGVHRGGGGPGTGTFYIGSDIPHRLACNYVNTQ